MCHICNSFLAATTSVTRNVNLAGSWFSTNSCQSCQADKSIIKRKGSKNYPKIPLSWTRYFFFSCHCRWNVGFMSHFWIFPRKSWVWSFCLDSTECLSHTLCNASLVELPADQGQTHRTLALSEETEEKNIRVLFCGGRAMRALFLIPGRIQNHKELCLVRQTVKQLPSSSASGPNQRSGWWDRRVDQLPGS